MKLITRDSDYAIRALCYVARSHEKRISVTELTKELSVPRPFLRKLLQILSIEGILASFKGKGGGFELAKKPEKILIADIMKIFQGQFTLTQCVLKGKICPEIQFCELRKKLDRIEKHVTKEIQAITIKSLIVEQV